MKTAVALAKSELPTLRHCSHLPAVEDIEPLYLFQELEPDLKEAGTRALMGTHGQTEWIACGFLRDTVETFGEAAKME